MDVMEDVSSDISRGGGWIIPFCKVVRKIELLFNLIGGNT